MTESATAARDDALADGAGVGLTAPVAVDATANGPTLKATEPVPVSPMNGNEIDGLRVTVVVTSAQARFVPELALPHRFELYVDRSGVWTFLVDALAPSDSGTSRHTFNMTLDEGASHRWRARAELDGYPGEWSTWAAFVTPVLKKLDPPTPRHPVNVTVQSLRPPLRVDNGDVAGADGTVMYYFEVDDDPTFSGPLRTSANRSGVVGDETVGNLSRRLAPGTTYSWKVRAGDDRDFGVWSDVVTFTTAAAPPPSPTSGTDEINASAVRYLHRNIAAWPITSTVTNVTIRGNGICVYHTGAGTFPTSKLGNPGEEIDVEGNVWVFAEFGSQWYGATWDYMRPGQQCKSENTDSLGVDQIRIPPMDHTWKPKSGDTLCFAVSARARDHVQAGRERTNIKCAVVP